MNINKNEPVFQYTLHRRLWNILADNPGMDKCDALLIHFTEEEHRAFGPNECMACVYGRKITNSDDIKCDCCPLDISGIQKDDLLRYLDDNAHFNYCLGSLFEVWSTAGTILQLGYINSNTEALCDYFGRRPTNEELKELCSKYARIIANLPVKPGVKYI